MRSCIQPVALDVKWRWMSLCTVLAIRVHRSETLIFDPYKLAATGLPNKWCYVRSHPTYDQEDFQDMNQVTRRGTNWRNLISSGEEDKSIEFSDGRRNCVALHQAGPTWRGGYVHVLHASICRTDTAVVRPRTSPTRSDCCVSASTTRKGTCADRQLGAFYARLLRRPRLPTRTPLLCCGGVRRFRSAAAQ
jgi:hypothetical protein